MAKTRFIKDRNGRFAGSIGSGKSKVPTAAKRPLARVSKSVPRYNAVREVARFETALATGNGLMTVLRRRRARRQLETIFGAIDWSDSATLA